MKNDKPRMFPGRVIACLLAMTVAPAYAQTAPQGFYRPGPLNGITDVPGVRVAHVTKISGNGALRPGVGPVRTGATVILPNDDIWNKRVSAAIYTLNGNCGELTRLTLGLRNPVFWKFP